MIEKYGIDMENMIYVDDLRKEFKKTIKEPGIKGSVKALFKPRKEIVKAVDGISFSVPEGEILGFIGPNGAGKSTVIKMLTGILTPTSGTCRINGKIPQEDRKNYVREIGVVFGQRTQLWWDLALRETYAVLKEIYQVPDDKYKQRMDFLNEVLELDSFITSPVRKDEGTTMVYYYVHDNQEIYEDFAGSAKITVLKDSTSQEVTTTQAPKKTTTVKKPELNKKGKLISVKSAKKGQLKIKWKKLTGITGYQIYISRNKKFTSHTLKKNFKKSKTGVTTGSWPSGRTIYVKMRPYKKKGGKRLFGYWSKVKKIRIK